VGSRALLRTAHRVLHKHRSYGVGTVAEGAWQNHSAACFA